MAGNDGQHTRGTRAIAAVCLLAAAMPGAAAAGADYEVWAIDQSNSPGRTYGGTLHVWSGEHLERGRAAAGAVAERVDLGGAAAALCFAKTQAYPVRPHMLALNARQTHAVVSFVASGHVLVLDAATREPVECIRTSAGAGGARQVHLAAPSPDETYIAVANQNGKLFERIEADFAANAFHLDPTATIDLAGCTTPNGLPCQDPALRPDNAPICPIVDATSRYVFVTLRGGGLFVVDAKATPMRIVAEYDLDTVHPNGCLGVQVRDKMYVDSGGGTASHLFGADVYAFPVTGFSPLLPPNTPPPQLVLSDPAAEADAHGATLAGEVPYLWVADRGRNFLWVIDTAKDEVVGTVELAGPVSADPTPDLLVTSPDGKHVFASLRGPSPLTADPHVSTGSTPGVGVIEVTEGGRGGRLLGVAAASNLDAAGVERADVHALAVRHLPEDDGEEEDGD